jgi:hypothetical protein
MSRDKNNHEVRYFKDEEDKEEIESFAVGSKAKREFEKSQHVEINPEKVSALIHEVEVLIEQLHHLYNLYFQRVEKRAPIEKRSLLDHQIKLLQNALKASPSLRFRANTVLSSYLSYKDRWDRKMKEMDSNLNQSIVTPPKPRIKIAQRRKTDA